MIELKLVELQKEINSMYNNYEYLSSINDENEILCNPHSDMNKIRSIIGQINKIIDNM